MSTKDEGAASAAPSTPRYDELCRENESLKARLTQVQDVLGHYRDALKYMASYNMTSTEQTLHIDFQGKARDTLAAEPEHTVDDCWCGRLHRHAP